MDNMAYMDSQRRNSEEYEALCKRCGKCCGLETDPCVNLKKDISGNYYCAVYESRLGRQVTVSGRIFTCVEIREVVRKGLPNGGCGYGR
ncbi:MAG: hypothetical protein PHV48_06060 [Candidatus Omnitrophica bacterium]|nr:hypothetical protein [Candidatus Omnitrophota bacterium]